MSVDENHLSSWKTKWTAEKRRSFRPGEILKELVTAINLILEKPITPPRLGGVVGILNLIPSHDYDRVIKSLSAVDDREGRNTPLAESLLWCCCGCKGDASKSTHYCAKTNLRIMGFCSTGSEGHGSSNPCKRCAKDYK